MPSSAWSPAALLVAACSSAPVGAGPLDGTGAPATQCVTAAEGQTVVMGVYALKNYSETAVTVRSVTFTKALHVAMTAAWVIPLVYPKTGDDEVVGAGSAYPPAS